MRVTLKDISKKSGFSVTTVSRALAGYDDVSQKTRDCILKIAEELGYQPNQIARQLQGQRTNTIGLIMPLRPATDDDDFFSLLLKGMTYEAARNGYDVLVSAGQPNTSEMDTYRRIVGGNRVDGLVLARIYRDDPRIEYLNEKKHPFVVLGRNAPDTTSDFCYIDVDSQLGIEMLIEHFVELGHQHIGIILPPTNVTTTYHRFAGYQAGLERAGIPFREDYCIYSDYTFDGGLSAAEILLDRVPQLTAIVACNDWMALGAITTAQKRGIKVGQEFAIGGYDDIPAAARAVPSLSTVHTPIYELGELLTKRLIKLIDNDPTAEQQLVVKPTLIIRESSGGSR
jgi:LacI family transcriptional regulator